MSGTNTAWLPRQCKAVSVLLQSQRIQCELVLSCFGAPALPATVLMIPLLQELCIVWETTSSSRVIKQQCSDMLCRSPRRKQRRGPGKGPAAQLPQAQLPRRRVPPPRCNSSSTLNDQGRCIVIEHCQKLRQRHSSKRPVAP